MRLSIKVKMQIVEILKGTQNYGLDKIEGFEGDVDDIEEIMADANYERCTDCDTWTECGELAANEEEYGRMVCNKCVEKNQWEINK